MNTRIYNNSHRRSSLDIQQLVEFDSHLTNESEDEKTRRRILYLRNSAQELNFGKSLFKGFGCVLLCFALIPLFWPMIGLFWFMKKKTSEHLDRQMLNAIEYWNLNSHDVFPMTHK